MSAIARAARVLALVAAAAACVPASAADGLGRLFFSPAERSELDRLKASPVIEQQAARVTVNGIVKSSSGRSVVWVNGVPHEAAAKGGAAIVRGSGGTAATVVAEPGKPPVKVKVGETVTLAPGAARPGAQ